MSKTSKIVVALVGGLVFGFVAGVLANYIFDFIAPNNHVDHLFWVRVAASMILFGGGACWVTFRNSAN
ncbi:hypothetical protein [Cerasicoccus fimbriatus]|uniref:hypothetical protein n=1 Tax=Cerasicoccus fimbriatus TaxID=3014554 RepID=UPI0022B4ED89|nr:hypothetical protein [Cerasicoccus sp. TK19100]